MSPWTLPALVLLVSTVLCVPVGYWLAWVYEGRFPQWLQVPERWLDSGPQTWRQYALALMLFNTLAAVVGFCVLAFQPWLPLNPDHKGMLEASTIFHTTFSFLTNTQQQHYSGEVHLSYFSQLFFICWLDFLSPSIGLAALAAVVRGLRGERLMGNFYVDLWRGVALVCLPIAFLFALPLLANGVPMTLEGAAEIATVEPGSMGTDDATSQPKPQLVARGPVAAILSIKQLGTNGGGYFGANSAHPFENPTFATNFLESVGILLVPFACVVMFGIMLGQLRHAALLFGVTYGILIALLAWCIVYDSLPNPGLTAHAEQTFQIAKATAEGGPATVPFPAVAGLPVDQSLGNLEGKELRCGNGAGPAWAVLATATGNGSVNCMNDSLNPLAGLPLLAGMWLNCIFSGVGTGLLNLLVYVVMAVFFAGLMVGRTPEYLGKKIEAREMKLAMVAVLVHPLLILGGTGLFTGLDWGAKSTNNPAAHGFSEILYEFSSASSNNGSGFEGLGDTYGFHKAEDNPSTPAPYSVHWNIACGLVILFGRYIPIIVPLALAGSVAEKKRTPFTNGTLRTDSLTFGFMVLGTILLVGALLFLPAGVLGPVSEHLGPIPFGG